MPNTTMTFNHGDYATLIRSYGNEEVQVDENHGDGTVTVRFLNSEDTVTVTADALIGHRAYTWFLRVDFTYRGKSFNWTTAIKAVSFAKAAYVAKAEFERTHMEDAGITQIIEY